MDRRNFLAGLPSLLIMASANAQGAAPEAEILHFPPYPEDPHIEIYKPGTYKLKVSRTQRKLFGGGHEGPRGGAMLDIFCGHVDVDLDGHTLGADFGIGGIDMSYKFNAESSIESPEIYGAASRDSRFISIRNGTIDLARGDRTLMAVSFVDEWDYAREYITKRPSIRTAAGDQPNMNIPYIRSEHLFEGLKLLAHDIAIGVEGSHTVIRNCIIESSSNAAIFIAGPNVTIENCDIRLRATEDEWYVEKNSTRAAIVLRDGSNAVIRNNRIRVDYGGSVPTETRCILVKDGAKNVLVEGNTFLNVRGKPVTLTEGSEAVERNNQMKRAG